MSLLLDYLGKTARSGHLSPPQYNCKKKLLAPNAKPRDSLLSLRVGDHFPQMGPCPIRAFSALIEGPKKVSYFTYTQPICRRRVHLYFPEALSVVYR